MICCLLKSVSARCLDGGFCCLHRLSVDINFSFSSRRQKLTLKRRRYTLGYIKGNTKRKHAVPKFVFGKQKLSLRVTTTNSDTVFREESIGEGFKIVTVAVFEKILLFEKKVGSSLTAIITLTRVVTGKIEIVDPLFLILNYLLRINNILLKNCFRIMHLTRQAFRRKNPKTVSESVVT